MHYLLTFLIKVRKFVRHLVKQFFYAQELYSVHSKLIDDESKQIVRT